ncbi:MAG: hypothetical protein ACRDEA_04055, partial [Microcystaceae cyanobacterium]
MAQVCKLSNDILDYYEKRKNQSVKHSPVYLENLRKRAAMLLRNLASNAAQYSTEAAQRIARSAQVQTLTDTMFALNATDLINLHGVPTNRIEEGLALELGQKAKAFGLSPDLKKLTIPGEVMEDIAVAKTAAAAIVDLQTKLKGWEAVTQHSDLFRTILGTHGIKNADIVDELFTESIEVGLIPKHRAGLNIGVEGDKFNMDRFDAFK